MMKRFETKGKILGLMLLALGLVFAGCVSDGDSSDTEAAVNSTPVQGQGIPMLYDNGSLVMGDGAQSYLFDLGGRSVELLNASSVTSNGSCFTDGSGVGALCDIVLINLDPDEFMTNVRVELNTPVAPDYVTPETDATMDNADYVGGVATNPSPPFSPDKNAGSVANISAGAVGMCYAADGAYANINDTPYNDGGCRTYAVRDRVKPNQMIHPECGSEQSQWDFGNEAARFYFWANIVADWHPVNPMSDGRYNFADRATFYVSIVDLSDPIWAYGKTAPNYYQFGSYQRSTVLAGPDPATGVAPSLGWNPVGGELFAVNVSADYADRIEAQAMGVGATPNFEYYKQLAYILKWNPNTVTFVTGSRTIPSTIKTIPGGVQLNEAGSYSNSNYSC